MIYWEFFICETKYKQTLFKKWKKDVFFNTSSLKILLVTHTSITQKFCFARIKHADVKYNANTKTHQQYPNNNISSISKETESFIQQKKWLFTNIKKYMTAVDCTRSWCPSKFTPRISMQKTQDFNVRLCRPYSACLTFFTLLRGIDWTIATPVKRVWWIKHFRFKKIMYYD